MQFRKGRKAAENEHQAGDSTMSFCHFDGNMYQMCLKDVYEQKASEEASSSANGSRLDNSDTVRLSSVVRQLAVAVESAKKLKSVKDLITLPGNTSPLGEKAGLSLTVVKSLLLRERDEYPWNDFSCDKGLHTLIESFLKKVTEGWETRCSSTWNFEEEMSLARDIHGAPFEGLVVRLAEAIGSFKTLKKMAIFWCEIVSRLRKIWCEGQHLPLIPLDECPDLNCCLLHQKFQVINCCVSRRRRRAIEMESLESVIAGGSRCISIRDDSKTLETLSSASSLYARTNNGALVLRVGVDSLCQRLKMLETGEPIYSPVTQEVPLMTEDVVKETEELVLRTGSVGAGCSQLLSDMQAFKAANPGCVLEDFVRWHSPPDWTEEGETATSPLRGQLSARMRKKGNLWRELWDTSKPVPAMKQAPLFDEELAVDGILRYLEDMAPSNLFDQLFISLLGSGLVNAGRILANAEYANLSLHFGRCKDYIVDTCRTADWTDKLDDLCQVYETVEMMALNPEAALRMMAGEGPKRRFKGFSLNFGGKEEEGTGHHHGQPFSAFFTARPSSLPTKKPPKPSSTHQTSDIDDADWVLF